MCSFSRREYPLGYNSFLTSPPLIYVYAPFELSRLDSNLNPTIPIRAGSLYTTASEIEQSSERLKIIDTRNVSRTLTPSFRTRLRGGIIAKFGGKSERRHAYAHARVYTRVDTQIKE